MVQGVGGQAGDVDRVAGHRGRVQGARAAIGLAGAVLDTGVRQLISQPGDGGGAVGDA